MIGYIGLGRMGGALARRLALSQEVLGFDLSKTANEDFAQRGGQVALSAAEVASKCELVFVCLPTSGHVEALLFGADGVAEQLRPGTVVIDQTSGDPFITRKLANELAKLHVTLADAPVSGGPRGADAGTIAIMFGGSDDTFEKVKPILETISPNVFRAGNIGDGHVVKLANNLLSGGIRLLTTEAIILAAKCGVSPQAAIDIMKKSGGSNSWLQQHGEKLFVKGENAASFTIGLSHKDISLACELGRQAGMPMFLGSQIQNIYQLAVSHRGFDTPSNDMIFVLEELANAKFIPEQKAP